MNPVSNYSLKQDIDKNGLRVFQRFLPQTILFAGSHRFKGGDPLATLLGNMRKEGVNPLGPELNDLIPKQVFRPLAGDKRLDSDFVIKNLDGR